MPLQLRAARRGPRSAAGTAPSSSSPATEAICLISELETWASSPSAIMNSVSTSGASRRLAIIIVNSAAMSVIGRTPRTMIRAPHCLTNSTASPVKVRISTFSRWAVASRINSAPLFGREQRLLLDVHAHAHDQPVEQPARPLHHVQMPERDRVEGAGIDGDARRRLGIGHGSIGHC